MAKGYYEQQCEDFALYSSPWEEHCQDSGSSDYYQEAYRAEAEAMDKQAEIEMIFDYMISDDFVGPLEEGFK